MFPLFSQFTRCLRTPAVSRASRTRSILGPASARSFHFSAPRLLTLTDPTRPSLYYHLLAPSDASATAASPAYFALSFLPSPPPSPTSRTVVGYLPAVALQPEADASAAEEAGDGLGLNDFRENPAFLQLLHGVIKAGVAQDEGWQAEAMSRQEGWMPISDSRNPAMPNRTPEPEDTIALVLVADGQIQPASYEPMPTYRVCTTDGVVVLTEGLERRLKEELERVDREERELGKAQEDSPAV